MKKDYLFLISIILIGSCNLKTIPVGKYASEKSPYSLIIKPDSTFEFKFYQFHVYEYSAGAWKMERRGKINLNSYYKDIKIPLTVVETVASTDSVNNLMFEFESNQIEARDCECTFYVNDKLKSISRCDSLPTIQMKIEDKKLFVEVRKSPLFLNSLRFSVNPLITNTFYRENDINSYKLRISVKDSFFSYKIFNDVSISIKKKGIYFYDNIGEKKHWIPRMN